MSWFKSDLNWLETGLCRALVILEATENPKHNRGHLKDKVWYYFDNNPIKHSDYFNAKCKFYTCY